MSLKDLVARQKSMDLVVAVYKYSARLPKSQQFVMIPQIQRAALSIPSNISEGYGRSSKADFARFIDLSLGSLRELETQLELCERLGYPEANFERELAAEVGRILLALAKSLRKP